MFDSLVADIRHALRRLAAAPSFTLAAVVCVAVGIAANATMFSLVNALLLRPLPGVPAPERLLEVGRSQDGRGSDTFGYPTLETLRQESESVELAGWTFVSLALGGDAISEAVMGLQVTDNYFDVLQVPMQLGRGFAAGESGADRGSPVVVIADSLWRSRYQADLDVVGRDIVVNGAPATIIGVAGPGFTGTLGVVRAQAWVPLGMRAGGFADPESLTGWANNFILGVGRLAPDASLATAAAELDALMAGLVAEHPEALRGQGVVVHELGGLPVDAVGPVRLFMAVLMVVVGLVLAVACINVAGMILARSQARGREVALRLALGARRRRLVQQLLTESFLLVTSGGLVGILGGVAATGALAAVDLPVPPPFDVNLNPVFDLRVALFAVLATAAAALLTGLGPALRASRPDLVPALKAEGDGSPSRLLARRVLIASQVGLTVLLVITAGLFMRALLTASSIDLGFDPDGVYALGLDTDLTGLDRTAGVRLMTELTAASAAVPGVEAASVSALLPLGLPSNMGFGGLRVAGFDPPAGATSYPASVNVIGSGYFTTMSIPVLAGEDFDATPPAEDRGVIINAHMAEFFWSDTSAVGQAFTLGEAEYTVRAVVADSRYQTLSEETQFFIYFPHSQRFRAQMYLVARIEGAPAAPIALVRQLAARLAPDLPVLEVVSLRSYADLGLLPQRVAAWVAGAMGAVVMLLAAVGIYGVTTQMARRRAHEIGIRMAVGADASDVVKLVVGQGMTAPLVGLVAGVILAAVVTRVLGSFLLGVSPFDPTVFVGGTGLLVSIALLANWAPARWASRVDPVQALRSE